MMPLFTVFTPTYNRAHLIHRVYDGLRAQTFRDFEWVVVDDGSSDGTKNLIEEWRGRASFPIRYFWQEHGHKKTAFNRGVKEAHGSLFLTVDSDDAPVSNALEVFVKYWLTIPEGERDRFVGVCGLCVNEGRRQVGTKFPADVFDSDTLESRHRYKVVGDKFGFSRTDVLRQFPFPEEVKGHVPESVIWAPIAKKYKIRYINEVLLINYQGPDSITRGGANSGGVAQNSEGMTLWAKSVLEHEIGWFGQNPVWFLKMAANYTRFGRHLREQKISRRYHLDNWSAWLLAFSMYPIGIALYYRDRARRR